MFWYRILLAQLDRIYSTQYSDCEPRWRVFSMAFQKLEEFLPSTSPTPLLSQHLQVYMVCDFTTLWLIRYGRVGGFFDMFSGLCGHPKRERPRGNKR